MVSQCREDHRLVDNDESYIVDPVRRMEMAYRMAGAILDVTR
jgi:hypothetical protein